MRAASGLLATKGLALALASLLEVEWCLINFNFVPYIHVSWEMSISACIEYSSCSLCCWCLDGFNQRALLVLFCTRQPRYPQGSLGILKALKNFIPSPFLRYRVSQQNLTNQSTVFENHPKCRIWVFEFWHFSPIFVWLKLTCLVTLFDRKLGVFKKSPKLTTLAF